MRTTPQWLAVRAFSTALSCGALVACAGHQTASPLPLAASNLRSTATPTPSPTPVAIAVNAASRGAVISRDMIGFETQATNLPWGVAAVEALGMTFNLYLPTPSQPNASGIPAYEAAYVQPNHVDLMFRDNLNEPTCTGLTTPGQWAGFVRQVNLVDHYNLKLWQIGFNMAATDEPWCGPPPAPYQDPGIYGSLQASIATAMKKVDSSIQTGVEIGGASADGGNSYWDAAVLASAKYDFVSRTFPSSGADLSAYYCSNPPTDACLLQSILPDLDATTANVHRLLTAAGKPATPVYIEEVGVMGQAQNNQSVSIVGGLYYGLLAAEAMRLGYAGLGFVAFTGTPCYTGFPPNPNVYGWQTWGTTSIVSNGVSCGNGSVPAGTPLPPARGVQLAAAFGHPGEHMLGTNGGSKGSGGSIVAYAATQGSGYAIFLFNLDPSNARTVNVSLVHSKRMAFQAVETTYDKSIYDQSRYNVWAPATTSTIGAVGTSFSVTLTPWSMNVVTLQ